MPKDKAKDRLIPAAHNYPMGFSLAPDQLFDAKKYYTDSAKKIITDMFNAFDKLYFKKHIPVYISEVGGGPLGIPVMERINCMKEFMAQVSKDGRSCAITLHPCNDYSDNKQDFDQWNIKWNEKPEYFNTIFAGAQGKEYPLSKEFIKENESKIESIVGKNLLSEPVEKKNWGNGYDDIKGEMFFRSVPARYKLEFQIETTGSNPRLDVAYWNRDLSHGKITKGVKGGTVDGDNIIVKSDTVIINIDEKLAKEIENSDHLSLNGQEIIIKSLKVVE